MYATNIFNYQVICLCVTPDTRIVKFSPGAARSAEIEIDIVPLSHPLAHLRGNLLLIYIERKKNAMFIDCTECGKHVFAHVSDKTLACMDLTEAVLCDECAED